MNKEEFTFLSADKKTNIHAVKWIPDDGNYKAILQITHGMVEFIERYEKFATYLTENGFLVVGHDHLGHGESVTTKDDWGYIGEGTSDWMVEDMNTLRTTIQGENPGVPYYMMGHSMGSYMLRKYLGKYSQGIQGAIIMGTGYMPEGTVKLAMNLAKFFAVFRGWRFRSKMIQSASYDKPYKKYDCYGNDPTNSWLTKDPEIVKWYYNEPKCTFMFTLNAYKALFEAVLESCSEDCVNRVNKDLPIFIVSGAEDPVGNLGEGVMKVYDMFKASGTKDVTYKLYENDRHEILNETDKEVVYSDILAWLNVHTEMLK